MNINIDLISGLYKKTAFIILICSILSFVIIAFLKPIFIAFSFSIGSFLIFLNVLGIYLIGKFSSQKREIGKDRIIFSIILFFGKLLLILLIIFLLIKLHLVDNKWFLGGLSLGFLIFFIANLVFLPIKIYKQEKISRESC